MAIDKSMHLTATEATALEEYSFALHRSKFFKDFSDQLSLLQALFLVKTGHRDSRYGLAFRSGDIKRRFRANERELFIVERYPITTRTQVQHKEIFSPVIGVRKMHLNFSIAEN